MFACDCKLIKVESRNAFPFRAYLVNCSFALVGGWFAFLVIRLIVEEGEVAATRMPNTFQMMVMMMSLFRTSPLSSSSFSSSLLLLHFFSPRMDGWQGCRWVWMRDMSSWMRETAIYNLAALWWMVGWRWIDKRRVCGWVMDSQQFCTDIYIHRLEIVECGPLINYFGDDSPTN